MSKILIIVLLLISIESIAQNLSNQIHLNSIDGKFDPSKRLCDLLEEKLNNNIELNRKNVENSVDNGVVVKWLKHNNQDYTQTRYYHMKLKVYSDAFISCSLFRELYYLIFDYANIDKPELIDQHKLFTKLIFNYIESGNKNLNEVLKPDIETFGSIKYLYDNKYEYNVFNFLPETGPTYPYELSNRIINISFEIENGQLKVIEVNQDDDKINRILEQRKVTPPPPPPPPMPTKN